MQNHMSNQDLDNVAHRLDTSDDVTTARRIDELHDEVLRQCKVDDEHIREFIKGLQRDVTDAEVRATPPDPAIHSNQLADLDAAFRESKARIDNMEAEARDLKEQREELKQRRSDAEASTASLARLIRAADPQLRNQISLYAHISRIAWRYNEKNQVAGTVSDRDKKDLRSFELDPSQLSPKELADTLWEVIG